MDSFRWGIFGTGEISSKFVAGLAAARGAEPEMVASRSIESARTFASGFGVARAVEGYAEAAAEGGVDAVYIATPPSEHAAHALLCIEAGIPVLVEKPFAASVADAQRIADAARASGVFAMEAMWTRFIPAAQAFREQVRAGAVGEVKIVAGSFGGSEEVDPASGNFDPARGGGTIAHLGTYPISLAQWLFGNPVSVTATGVIGATGVDEVAAIQVVFGNGVVGSFTTSIRAALPNDFHVGGTRGMIAFDGPIFRPHGIRLAQQEPYPRPVPDPGWKNRLKQHGTVHGVAQMLGVPGKPPGRKVRHAYSGNGYNYEADEVRNCVERGDTESAVMPLADSIAVLDIAERARQAIRSASGGAAE